MNATFSTQQQGLKHNPNSILSKINSASYLNNIAMKYRFEKMELTKLLAIISPNKRKLNKNIFERVKSSQGLHLDRDIKYSQSIRQAMQQKQSKGNDSSIKKDSMNIQTTIRSEPLLSLYEKKTTFFKRSSLLQITNDSYDEFICALNKEEDNRINQPSPNKEVIKKALSFKERLKARRIAQSEQSKEAQRIKPESLVKKPRKIYIDLEKMANITVRIPKIEEKHLILNQNCIKMKANLSKAVKNNSELNVNTNYLKVKGKDGDELYLDYYLTPFSNYSALELSSPLGSNEYNKPLLYCNSTSSLNSKQYGLSMSDFKEKAKTKKSVLHNAIEKGSYSSQGLTMNKTIPVKFFPKENQQVSEADPLVKWKRISDRGFKSIIDERDRVAVRKMGCISEQINLISKKINRKIEESKGVFFSKVDTVSRLTKKNTPSHKREKEKETIE